jgi:hypothetical protein
MSPREFAEMKHAVIWAKRKGLISVKEPSTAGPSFRSPPCTDGRVKHRWLSSSGNTECLRCGTTRAVSERGMIYTPASTAPSAPREVAPKTIASKNRLRLLFLFLYLLLLQGCMVGRFNRETCSLRLPIPPAGQDWGDVTPKWERVRFTIYSCMADDKVSKIKVDYSTKTTYTGISIGTVDHEIDNEAVEAMTKGVTAAFLEALKHL